MSEVDTSAEAVERLCKRLSRKASMKEHGMWCDTMDDAAELLRALRAERDALEETMAREAENACAVVAAEVAARVTAEAERDAAQAERDRLREACSAGLSALIAHEAYMTAAGHEGPDSDALHPRAAENWRNVRAAIRAINALEGRSDV